MSNKLRKKEDQPTINEFLTTPKALGQVQTPVQEGDPKYATPSDSKRKCSPPSDNKLVKKLNLDNTLSDSEEEHIISKDTNTRGGHPLELYEMNEEGKDKPTQSDGTLDQPSPEQIAFEDRLIAKFSQMMSEKLRPLEDSIKQLAECQQLHSDSIKEIGHIQSENVKLRRQMEYMSKENTILCDRIMRIENKLLENCIVPSGIPEEPWELESNLQEKIIKILAHTVDAANYEDQLEVIRDVRIDKVHCKGSYSTRSNRPVSVTFGKYSDAAYVLENRYYLPEGIYVAREYTEETERKRAQLRPYLQAAKNMSQYAGRCRIAGDKLILNGRKYSTDDLDKLPTELSGFEISSKRCRSGMCFFGELNPLSNFHRAQFNVDNEVYHSSEQFIQKVKADYFGDAQTSNDIMRADTPLECKQLARNITRYDHIEWSRIARSKCECGITCKFQQNPALMNLLISTGEGILAEASYNKLWGTGVPLHHDNALNQEDWANVGILGEILMKIREDNSEYNISSGNTGHAVSEGTMSHNSSNDMDQ